MAVKRVSHVGLCVRELERARRFYCEGLGFRELSRLEAGGAETARLLGLAGAQLEAVYLTRDGLVLELLHYASPGCEAGAGPRAMNRAGLTHLSVVVDDLDGALATLRGLGGQALAESRIENPAFRSRAMFVLDPDGTRVELVEGDFDPARLPASGASARAARRKPRSRARSDQRGGTP